MNNFVNREIDLRAFFKQRKMHTRKQKQNYIKIDKLLIYRSSRYKIKFLFRGLNKVFLWCNKIYTGENFWRINELIDCNWKILFDFDYFSDVCALIVQEIFNLLLKFDFKTQSKFTILMKKYRSSHSHKIQHLKKPLIAN